jgi:hypothetical protein
MMIFFGSNDVGQILDDSDERHRGGHHTHVTLIEDAKRVGREKSMVEYANINDCVWRYTVPRVKYSWNGTEIKSHWAEDCDLSKIRC